MEQPSALRNVEAVRVSAPATGADVWDSDLADIAALPLTAVDGLSPLDPTARILQEVLRARSSIRGGGEGTGGARAE